MCCWLSRPGDVRLTAGSGDSALIIHTLNVFGPGLEFGPGAHRLHNIIGAESLAHQALAERVDSGGGDGPAEGLDLFGQRALEQPVLVDFLKRLAEGGLDVLVIDQLGLELAADAVPSEGAIAGQRRGVQGGELFVVEIPKLAEPGNSRADGRAAAKLPLERAPHLGDRVRPAGQHAERGLQRVGGAARRLVHTFWVRVAMAPRRAGRSDWGRFAEKLLP